MRNPQEDKYFRVPYTHGTQTVPLTVQPFYSAQLDKASNIYKLRFKRIFAAERSQRVILRINFSLQVATTCNAIISAIKSCCHY